LLMSNKPPYFDDSELTRTNAATVMNTAVRQASLFLNSEIL
jgi:hypothetical protein